MADQKPPKVSGDERALLLSLLQYTRESFLRKVEDLSDDDARRRHVPSSTTLLWLVQHLAHAETLWIVQRFAGEPFPERVLQPGSSVADAVATYRETWTTVDAIVARSDLDQVCHSAGEEASVNLRWVLLHLLEETARHAGHADILRELTDGSTGR